MFSREIMYYNPDILCLQEIEKGEQIISRWLAEHGYTFSYKKRTRDRQDGCVVAYKEEMFEVRESKYLEFFVDTDDILLNRDNVAQIVILKSKFTTPRSDQPILIFVVNCHLLFNMNRGEIKVAQLYYLMQAVNKLKQKYSKHGIQWLTTIRAEEGLRNVRRLQQHPQGCHLHLPQ